LERTPINIRNIAWSDPERTVILSTHSPYVLDELPSEARILLLPGPAGVSVVYGVSTELAMTRIDESVHPEAYVFVEDREAGTLLREILVSNEHTAELLQRVEIVSVGPVNVVQLLGSLAAEQRLPYRSLAVVDGGENATEGCIALPGASAPEHIVYQGLRDAQWPNLPERFGIGAGVLLQALEDAMLEPDHHRWNTLVGNATRKSAQSVWEILANEWAKGLLLAPDRDAIAGRLNDILAQG
jgi:hypothetical protein